MRKSPINIIGGFYKDPNLHWSRQRTVNWIPVRAEREGTLTPIQLRDAPGVKPFVRITRTVESEGGPVVIDVGPGRGLRNVEGKLFVVAAQTLYQISNTGVAIPFGTIPGVGRVSMSHNQRGLGNELATDNGSARYVFNTNTQVLQKVTDEAFPGSFMGFFIDGYQGFIEPQGRYWGHSELADALAYNSLDRYEAEGDPDRIVSGIVSHREVLIFGRETIEPYVNTGQQTGTFERASNTVIEVGCAAKFTPRLLDNSVLWLDDKRIVRRMEGYTPVRISTDAIDAAFSECTAAQIANAYAFTWETRGHKVYYTTVPGMFTFGYDVLTGQWHERATWGMQHWDVIDLAFWNGKWIALSGQNGRLYELDQNYKLDRCDPLVRKRVTGKLWDSENEMTLNNVELKFNTGGPVSTCVLFPDQPEGPTLTGAAPDGETGEPYSFSYTATPGDSPIARTVIRSILVEYAGGVFESALPAGWSWNQSTATISGPAVENWLQITLNLRTIDDNGLYDDHTDTFQVVEIAMLLITGSAIDVGEPVFVTADTVGDLEFEGLVLGTGANLPACVPVFYRDPVTLDETWFAASSGATRYSTNNMTSWLTGSLPFPEPPVAICPGPEGWLISPYDSSDTAYRATGPGATFSPYLYDVVRASTPDQLGQAMLLCKFIDGDYTSVNAYYPGYVATSTDLDPEWQGRFRRGDDGPPNGNTISAFYDMVKHEGVWYATVNFSPLANRRTQLRRSLDDRQTWPDLLIDVPFGDIAAPWQICSGVGVLLVYAWGGQRVWTSEDNFDTPHPTGIQTIRALNGGNPDLEAETRGRQLAYAEPKFFLISGDGDSDAVSNKCITTMDGITFSDPVSIPLTDTLGITCDWVPNE